MKQSTTEVGNQLRDYVVELLESRGFLVQQEIRVKTKKIDVMFVEEDELTRRNIAIEVKNYNRNLSQEEVNAIYTEHRSLIYSRDIDEVWVVVRKDFSPDAKNWAREQHGLRLFSIAEFEERQFGFRRYVRQVIEIFKEQDLDKYYVHQRVTESDFLKDKINSWIENDVPNPVAILGGYGMGKTSFCKYLVAELGQAYLLNAMKRVPIYVRLSEIAKEQDLEGLLGKTLASTYRLNNYFFQDFMNLNRKGKFVFIFDGFDEMKHALTWDLFKYNFSQINRTVSGKSKVIIAGRPNAFLSDDEHSWALRGTRSAGERILRLPDWPEYWELAIQPFSVGEAKSFLGRYLENTVTSEGKSVTEADRNWVEARVEEFESLSVRDVVARPVHLKIFADVAKNREFQLRELNAFELYDLAAQQTIDREMEKPERLNISADSRLKFVYEVAWWLWEKDNGRNLHFQPMEIPSSIRRQVVIADHQITEEGLLRELFSGPFVERKFGENFYFAHRSFLEFFVAKKLVTGRAAGLSLSLINMAINEEIMQFIRVSGRFPNFADYVIELLYRYSGEIKLTLIREISKYVESNAKARSKADFQRNVDLLFTSVPLYESARPNIMAECFDVLLNELESTERENAQTALYYLVDVLLFGLKSPEFKNYLDQICRCLAANVDIAYLRAGKAQFAALSLRFSRQNIFEYVFLRAARVAAEVDRTGAQTVLVDFGRILADLSEARKPKIVIANRATAVEVNAYVYSISFDELFPKIVGEERAVLIDTLRTGIQSQSRA
jgi:hypothetical protein